MVCSGLGMVAQGYLYDASIGPWSVFYLLFLFQTFFGSANYSVVGPYMAEIWPARLRASGMGLSYGVGNLGKFVGPLGLALIMGAGDLIKPAAPNLVMLGPALIYFASWYVLGLIGFWAFGYEPKGRTFEEIDDTLDAPMRTIAEQREQLGRTPVVHHALTSLRLRNDAEDSAAHRARRPGGGGVRLTLGSRVMLQGYSCRG